jgi:hypothetical protein
VKIFLHKIIFLSILVITSVTCVYSQERVESINFFEVKEGIYSQLSIDSITYRQKFKVISSQKKIKEGDSIVSFIHPQNHIGVLLFEDSFGKKISGILVESSIVEVDSIFYRDIFKDPSKDWSLTFNVWYAIKINDQKYYTDFKIHDSHLYSYNCGTNKFLLIAQSSGYDDYYDRGYPELFFGAIINEKGEILNVSNIFSFTYGDEYFDAIQIIVNKVSNEKYLFELEGLDEKLQIIIEGIDIKNLNTKH